MSSPKARLFVVTAGPEADDPDPVDTPSMKKLATFGGVLLLLLAGAYLWSFFAIHSPVRDLPETQRRVLFERTQANLREVCAPKVAESLHTFCRQQAELLSQFQECGSDCQRLVATQLSHPTR